LASRIHTALIKRQWGTNVKKYDNVELPNGVKIKGQKIWDEAKKRLRALREEMIVSYSLPVTDMIG
jgi:hypothetical protein